MSKVALPGWQRGTLVTLAVWALLLIVFVLPESLKFSLRYDRMAIADGEVWRLLTGQLVHWRASHLGYNLLGMAVMAALFYPHLRLLPFSLMLLLCLIGSNLGLWFAAPDIIQYAGFSGVLYGIFAWGALLDVQQGRRFGWLLLALIIGKTTLDMWAGESTLTFAGSETSRIAYQAHFFGMLSGVFAAGITAACGYWRR